MIYCAALTFCYKAQISACLARWSELCCV